MNYDQTLVEAMAIAVLRGDRAAAYALADKLIEEREEDQRPPMEKSPGRHVNSLAVFRWPEFLAFLQRLGVKAEGSITAMSIVLRIGDAVRVTTNRVGKDTTLPTPDGGFHDAETP